MVTMLSKTKAVLAIFFILFAVPSYALDCCGPGGSVGGSIFASSVDGSDNYRIKSPRHYSYSARHPGFMAGFDVSGFTEKSQINFSPRLQYSNSFGNLDVFGGLYYTAFLEKPHSHQIDLSENIAWRITPTANTRLVFRLDNENIWLFFPEDTGLKYAAVDPSVAWSAALNFGDITFSGGLPFIATTETGQSALWFCAEYVHPIGLGLSLCPTFLTLPDAQYNGTTLTLSFVWDTFFAKAAFLSNNDLSEFQIRPYVEFTIRRIVLWAGAEFSGLGTEDFTTGLFAGVGYHF